MAPTLGRRGFLGYLGTAAAGTAAGAGAGVVGARALDADEPTAVGVRRTGEAVSPWGAHQPGIAAHPGAVTELVALDLRPALHRAGDVEALARLMRVWTTDVEALTAGRGTPGDTAPWLATANADLTVTVGLGPRLFDEPWGLTPPRGFGRVPAMKHDRLDDAWSGGDLVAVVSGRDGTTVGHAVRRLVADAAPFAALRWRQTGSWQPHDAQGRPHTGRNLFGQVDGSANPRPGTDLFDQTVWVKDGLWAAARRWWCAASGWTCRPGTSSPAASRSARSAATWPPAHR
ncbi:Dyp-type peroxidase [Nocardioides daphniae]|uniref:Dyp-type peroxidase n=1 Tax=Nocardioides daphniae TaxID=402297 RepID=UPI001EE874F5|nr:Dyp-type peroxidase domain-containing protein [Nocardioides daphniae]